MMFWVRFGYWLAKLAALTPYKAPEVNEYLFMQQSALRKWVGFRQLSFCLCLQVDAAGVELTDLGKQLFGLKPWE